MVEVESRIGFGESGPHDPGDAVGADFAVAEPEGAVALYAASEPGPAGVGSAGLVDVAVKPDRVSDTDRRQRLGSGHGFSFSQANNGVCF